MSRPPPKAAPGSARQKGQSQLPPQQTAAQSAPSTQPSAPGASRQPSHPLPSNISLRTSSPQLHWPPPSGSQQAPPAHRGSFTSTQPTDLPPARSTRIPSLSYPTTTPYLPQATSGQPPPGFGPGAGTAYMGERGSPRGAYDMGGNGLGMFRSPQQMSAGPSSSPYNRPPSLSQQGSLPPQQQQQQQQQRRLSSISMLYDSTQAGPSTLPLQSQSQASRPSASGMSNAAILRSPEKEEDEEDYDDDEMADDTASQKGKGRGTKRGADGDEEDEASGAGLGLTATGRKRRPHATRRRVVQSCSECRRRKIKCDKKFPCGPCVLRNEQTQCHEVGMAEKNVSATPFAYATASDLALVAQRLDALESALTKSGALIPAEMDQYLRQAQRSASFSFPADGPSHPEDGFGGDDEPRLVKAEDLASSDRAAAHSPGAAPSAPSSTARPSTPLPPAPKPVSFRLNGSSNVRGAPTSPADDGDADLDPGDDTEGAALTLEHLAFGRSTAEGAHAIPHFGARVPSAISKHAPNNDYHLARPHPLPLQAGQGGTPPGSMGPARVVPGSAPHTSSAGNSPAEMRRKSSILVPPSRGSAGSVPGVGEGGGGGRRDPAGAGSYGATLSEEDRAMRIDALLDLIGPMDVFTLFYRKTDVGLRALSKVLPDRERGELLVRTYLEKVDWLHRCLHVPTFLRQCNDLWALPHDMVVHDIALPFVALYYSICCLGVQFMDTSEARKHFTDDEIRDLPDLYFNAARSCMWAGDFIGRHAVENLQCLLLLSVFMNNRDRGEAAWALLGAAIKMAQGLGLSRLGAEPTSTDAVKSSPMWAGRWESVIEREVGRRIWWNLVFLDWALSPSYNFSCSIHPDQIKTALPSNIEDEDIVEGQPLRPQPLNVRTGMSFVLARIAFIQIAYRQICEANIHRHPPYSFILSVDSELRKVMMDLPSFFQPNSSDRASAEANGTPPPVDHNPKSLVRYYEKVMLNLAIHSRMLRLHRPWLARGYTDERFAYSKEQCIRAARASLRLMSDTHGTAAFLEKWWLPLFYVSVSGLVVIIDLLRTNRKDMHSRETEQKISEVRGALDQMRQIADVSHPSRSAVKVMEFLLAEVEERRRPPGSSSAATGKRKAPDDDETDGLQRAVKKLIRQAQLETDSPTTSHNTIAETPPSVSTHSHASVSPLHDPARDRPVFDAYPLLPSAATLQQRADDTPTLASVAASAARKGNPSAGGFSLVDFNFDTPPPQSSSTLPFPPSHPRSGSMSGPSNAAPNPSFQSFRQYANPQSTSPFPFQMDFDPSFAGNGAFPTFPPNTTAAGPPQLDPSVEDLLANYFPTPQQQQQNGNGGNGVDMTGQGWGTVPDDFLSRVFSFSWDTTPGNGGGEGVQGGGAGMQQPAGGQNRQLSGMGPGGQRQGSVVGSTPGQPADQGQPSQGQNQGNGLGVSMPGQGQGNGTDFVPFDWGTTSGGWMA